jgi:hypothetical protein
MRKEERYPLEASVIDYSFFTMQARRAPMMIESIQAAKIGVNFLFYSTILTQCSTSKEKRIAQVAVVLDVRKVCNLLPILRVD